MITTCANAQCNASFGLMQSGRIFRIERPSPSASKVAQDLLWDSSRPRIEHYWLCDKCAGQFTVVVDAEGGIIISRIGTTSGISNTNSGLS
ncbi:MAG TPA: hypothetical protein VN622_16795 [Clostridia bacterium]|nr:hypothetical protein [Clostridia bacterium]